MASSDSELKAILHTLLAEIDNLRVNQELILAASKAGATRGDLLDQKRAAESANSKHFAKLRKQIDDLPL